MNLNDFIAALTPEEKARFDAIAEACGQPDANFKTLTKTFQQFAVQVHARLGLENNPGAFWGPLWGQAKRQFTPKKADPTARPMSELAGKLPYPLGLKVRHNLEEARLREAGEPAPQYAFNLCATMGILVRMSAIIAIGSQTPDWSQMPSNWLATHAGGPSPPWPSHGPPVFSHAEWHSWHAWSPQSWSSQLHWQLSWHIMHWSPPCGAPPCGSPPCG